MILSINIWSYLCVVDVLFLGFYWPLWILRIYGGCGLHGRKYFLVPDRSNHLGSQVECFNFLCIGDDTKGWKRAIIKGSTRKRKARLTTGLVESERENRCSTTGYETGELELENRKENEDHLPNSKARGGKAESTKRIWRELISRLAWPAGVGLKYLWVLAAPK